MKKNRLLKNKEVVEELDQAVSLLIYTRCPKKWIIEDMETGKRYRANGSLENGKMFSLIKNEKK